MTRLIFSVAAIVLFSPAASGEAYIRDGWPGDGTPRLAARNDVLILYKTPDATSDSRRLKYQAGWQIIWDESQVITRKSVVWTVKKEITKGTCGTVSPGEEVEFLQFESQGWGTFRVGDKLCTLKATERGNFDNADEWPVVEWWVRVTDNTKSPVGWLLVEAQQVDLLSHSYQ